MPRLAKHRRDEMRFGGPQRLADLIVAGQFAELESCPTGPGWRESYRRNRDLMLAAVAARVIDVTEVHRHALALQDADPGETAWDPMIVDAVPPGPLLFVESKIGPELSPQVRHCGWALAVYPRGEEPQLVYDALVANPLPDVYERCEWIAVGTMAMGMKIEPTRNVVGVMCPATDGILFLDGPGNALSPPVLALPEFYASQVDRAWVEMWAHNSFFDSFLAFSLLNRRVATIVAREPPAEVDRNRVRAGLKPLVRYDSVVMTPPSPSGG